jgi:hypothetical protein
VTVRPTDPSWPAAPVTNMDPSSTMHVTSSPGNSLIISKLQHSERNLSDSSRRGSNTLHPSRGIARRLAPWPFPRSLLRTNLTLFSRLLQLPIPLSVDLRLTPGEHVLRCDVANRAVQADEDGGDTRDSNAGAELRAFNCSSSRTALRKHLHCCATIEKRVQVR